MSKEEIIKVDGKEIKLSNIDKVLFPKSGITKGQVIKYYYKISKKMLPYLKDRPIAMQRFPDGINKEGFYQKDISEYFPDWVGHFDIPKKEHGKTKYVIIEKTADLVYLATQAVITVHTFLSRKDKLNYHDKIVFDLDPSKENDFENVKKAALKLKKFLEKLGIKPLVMATGSRGLHIIIIIKRNANYKEVKEFIEKIAEKFAKENRDLISTEFIKKKREGKIFLDYRRNYESQHAVAPYSIRAGEGAPVAVPLSWKEVNKSLKPDKYNIKNIFKRKNNPWKNMGKNKVNIKNIMASF